MHARSVCAHLRKRRCVANASECGIAVRNANKKRGQDITRRFATSIKNVFCSVFSHGGVPNEEDVLFGRNRGWMSIQQKKSVFSLRRIPPTHIYIFSSLVHFFGVFK